MTLKQRIEKNTSQSPGAQHNNIGKTQIIKIVNQNKPCLHKTRLNTTNLHKHDLSHLGWHNDITVRIQTILTSLVVTSLVCKIWPLWIRETPSIFMSGKATQIWQQWVSINRSINFFCAYRDVATLLSRFSRLSKLGFLSWHRSRQEHHCTSVGQSISRCLCHLSYLCREKELFFLQISFPRFCSFLWIS